MNTKSNLSNVMKLAWQFVKENGLAMGEAMKLAWKNIKLRIKMATATVVFFFKKVDGTVRKAVGTLDCNAVPSFSSNGNRKPNNSVQTYYDVEKNNWRCFKKTNLISVQ